MGMMKSELVGIVGVISMQGRECCLQSLFFLFIFANKVLKVRNVFTIRITEDYLGMLENINLELQQRGISVKDNVLIKTVLLTGIRAINQKFTQGINVFDTVGDED